MTRKCHPPPGFMDDYDPRAYDPVEQFFGRIQNWLLAVWRWIFRKGQ